MIKRPKPGETEEDILRMQQEFLSQKAKNPKLQPAATMVKINRPPKQSLFAKSRQQNQASVEPPQDARINDNSKRIYQEIHEKIVGDGADDSSSKTLTDIVMGDIVEKTVERPKVQSNVGQVENTAFPKIQKISLKSSSLNSERKGKSIFAQAICGNRKGQEQVPMEIEENTTDDRINNLNDFYAHGSVVVEDTNAASEIHKENINMLCKMKEEEILAERKKLMESIDPAIVALLAKKRQEKAKQLQTNAPIKASQPLTKPAANSPSSPPLASTESTLETLPSSNPAVEILQRSAAEQWIHFDVVEKDKLEWMRDIPLQASKLKPGEKFEARFDWKGVLLPYSMNDIASNNSEDNDDRELYLHGDEPHRPGYTLQELFRLARSNVMQQRVTAFSALAGMLSIYQQGFYDQVLELPISKIFFLLRFGFDDNTPAMLEIVGKALAYLFYNETDETLLDFVYENPGCQWQPCLQVLNTDSGGDEEMSSIEHLQKQMEQLQMSFKGRAATVKANVEENEEESKTSMSDFQLAETDLIDCLLRTNILQRIYFILNTVRPDNSTVSSCLKLLIRLARSGKEVAMQIVNNDELMKCLFENFLPGLEKIDTSLRTPPFYNYPQYLCLKLMRSLISCNLSIATKLMNMKLIDILENYLFNREDIKTNLIKVQIESLRCLRCLLLLRMENNTLHKKFLHAFRYMLDWHFNHVIYEEGGPFLIRQHAAAVLATIASISSPVGSEVTTLLGDILHDCSCNWFHKATRFGVKEFSQATLLSSCLNAVTWYIRHTDTARYQNFIQKYLSEFIQSENFVKFLNTISSSSLVLRRSVDRRNVHNPLPNVGAVIMNSYGPQLVITQTYPIFLITTVWRFMELLLERNEKHIFDALLSPKTLDPMVDYLRNLSTKCNRYLATNFFAKMEIKLLFKLLCFEGFSEYFKPSEMLQIVYNFLCCLTAEHIPEVEELFERVIFNRRYINIDEDTLNKWRKICLELVYSHYIVVPPTELTLFLPFSQVPILPPDWPYFQLKIILQNYVENVQQKKSAADFSEREILQMTLNFVTQLEDCNEQLEIVSPTEKLMYLMIAFMGPESQFLDREMNQLLRQHLKKFYQQCENVEFLFDKEYQGKCKFENLYVLFVDHFQAASYGDELFSSLLMIPLAQKYDNKWRRRVWSDCASALRFLDCSEELLIGGLNAYLYPCEEEASLVKLYNEALNMNLVRPNSVPYKIARHHVDKFKERFTK
ncbi:RNA polymerase II-associated protein 1 isoform X1 [Stomoxys calcitrans]|uniref:RNA polymerase II-associated protein 1 isoform X1 n=1 Tax=Stomoxys calcitrans TaxID=35570 RepID=UPI0027E28271|nr:RNA polymerase II-associated protein 1 isoform X1 [Stomoxys calcitrans]